MPSDFIQGRIDRLLAQAADAADELDWDQAIKFAEATCRSRIILSSPVTAATPTAEPRAAQTHSKSGEYIRALGDAVQDF